MASLEEARDAPATTKECDVNACLDIVTGCLDDESKPLLGSQPNKISVSEPGWTMRKISVVAVVVSSYIFCIAPVAVPASLLPSLEDDRGLKWGPAASGLYLSVNRLAELCGTITLGWAADAIGAMKVFSLYLLFASFGLGALASQQVAWRIMLMHGAVSFAKGTAWPAVPAMLGRHLGGTENEVGIFLVAMASRFGDFGTSESIGLLLTALSWRDTVRCVAATLFAVALLIRIAPETMCLRHLQHDSGPEASRPGTTTQVTPSSPLWPHANARRCLSEVNTWVLIGCDISWAGPCVFFNCVAAFAHSIYNVKDAESAMIGGAIPVGSLLGLLCGLLIMLSGAQEHRRLMHVSAVALLWIGSLIAVVLVVFKASLLVFVILTASMAFCCVLAGYVPTAIYCIETGRSGGDVALRTGLIHGIGAIAGSFAQAYIGFRREASETIGFRITLYLCAGGFLVSGLLMGCHTQMNWNGYLKARGNGV